MEGASCFLSLRDVAGAVMLGWARQPAGTRAGSPGRAAAVEGGGLGSLGHRANVKSNRNEGGGAGSRRRRGMGCLDTVGWGREGGIFQDPDWP